MALLAALAVMLGTAGGPPPAGCTATAGAPQVLTTPLGPVSQRRLTCGEGSVFLTLQGTKLAEVYVVARDDPGADALAKDVSTLLQQPRGEVELAFARYDGPNRVQSVTLSFGGFSWDVLPGESYADKLKTYASKHPQNVSVSPDIRLTLPGVGKVHAVVTTLTFGGSHVDSPGPSVVHLIADSGKVVARIYAQFPGSFGALAGGFSPLPISPTESVLKYASGYTGQGYQSERSWFYRIDAAARRLTQLALTEGSSNTQESIACLEKGQCREVRYGLLPAEQEPTGDGVYAFSLVRVEIRRTKKGAVVKTTQKVFGTCTYEPKTQDYRCPKLPDDGSI